MYDDKTFDAILADMLQNFGEDVRTDEKSLAYNACAKIADKLEAVYGDMDELGDNMLPDTQDIAHLIRYAQERGISYKYATNPIVRGVFSQTIDDGEQFTCGDYTYTVTGVIDGETYNYYLTCETDGTEANTTVGELSPVSYIDDYQGGEITEILTPGEDDEDDEAFRQRVIDSFQAQAFGGNRADYRLYIDALSGVGGCKPKRRDEGDQWIYIYLLDSDYNVPSATLVETVQSAVDPEENHGEGEGMAPICHEVLIQAATGVTCNISATVTLDTGYTVEGCQTDIENAIEAYMYTLRTGWEGREFDSTVVRISQIEARILTVEGVLDVNDVEINDDTENVILTFEQVPVLGEVVLSV